MITYAWRQNAELKAKLKQCEMLMMKLEHASELADRKINSLIEERDKLAELVREFLRDADYDGELYDKAEKVLASLKN